MCGGDQPYMGPEMLEREHQNHIKAAMKLFTDTRKMGGDEFSQKFKEQLELEIENLYVNLAKHNESKNIFAAARTPGVLLSVVVVIYVMSGILGMIGLETLANMLNLLMGATLVTLGLWLYIRYSGEYREMGVQIDKAADAAWDLVSRDHVDGLAQDCSYCSRALIHRYGVTVVLH